MQICLSLFVWQSPRNVITAGKHTGVSILTQCQSSPVYLYPSSLSFEEMKPVFPCQGFDICQLYSNIIFLALSVG